tara:strand:- start:273 stop:644 length:372 start_codon:yes stop_codon:yes gene_type:complete
MSKKIFLTFSILYLFLTNILIADTSSNLEIKILKNLRCLICQGQSIYDSQSDFAESMKIVVRKKLESGMTEKEIYNFLKNKYGNWILYEPQFEKNTLFLWLIPIFLFILGGILIVKKIEVLKK